MPEKTNQKVQMKQPIEETPKLIMTPEPEVIESPPKPIEVSAKSSLVEFPQKNPGLPEWRLQLKNAVRQRQTRSQDAPETGEIKPAARSPLATSGANALKAEEALETQIEEAKNPTLANALQRIEKSRKRFLTEPSQPAKNVHAKAKPNKTHLYIAAKSNEILPKPPGVKSPAIHNNQLKMGDSFRKTLDLKAPEKPTEAPKPAQISTSFDRRPIIPQEIEPEIEETVVTSEAPIEQVEEPIEENSAPEIEFQEIEDCAPLAMRFNAGLFDLIIGSFTTLLLLSPLMAMGANWFSLTGILTFLAVNSVVMFTYMTVSIGMYARTFGMKLFSLEVVDIEGEEYPTIHQAAVSSCVHIISLVFGGLGFLTIFLNDEKRAAHDLVSRTIVVKEF